MAAEFAMREIAPVAARAASCDDDGHVSADDYLAVHRAAARAGLTSLLIPSEYGGGGGSVLDNVIVQEELGAADAGIGAGLNLSTAVPGLIVVGGTEAQRAAWLPTIASAEDFVLAGALNEPNVSGAELFAPPDSPASGIRTIARRDGDDYVLSGAKVAWVTNGGVAKGYFVFARTDAERPAAETASCFFVPADTPGLSTGARTELLGMRTGWHAEVFLDDVRVPADRRIGDEGSAFMLMAMASGPMAVGLAATFVGVARAANELAVEYTTHRHSWGVPIRAHQAVALELADSYVAVQAARLLVWDAAAALDRGDPSAGMLKVPAAKAYAVDAAIKAAQCAVKVMGATGVARGGRAEQYLRDAWTGYTCDFSKEMLLIGLAGALGANELSR